MASPNHTPVDPQSADENVVAVNREAWLQRAIDIYFRPVFDQLGYAIPPVIHVSVGWGAGRAGAESKDIAGQCWGGSASADSYPHIFISPAVGDAAEVLGILAHELVHATLDPFLDHGKDFRDLATAIGLMGKMTATTPDMATYTQYMLLASDGEELGPYPHSAISLLSLPRLAAVPELVGAPPRRISSGPAPQTARWFRVRCPEHPDGGSVRISRATAERGATPLCGEPVGEVPAAGEADVRPPCGLR